MSKMSGWQKAGLIAGAGCLSIIGLVVIGLIVAVTWARATLADLGDTTPTSIDRTIPLAESAGAAPGAAAPGASADAAPLRLTIDLEEGSFTIRPGPPGGQVQVTGRYAPNLYELTETQDTDGGVPRATIRFRSKAPQWARMFAGIGNDDDRPELTVVIPEGAAMDLSLRVSMGESRVDLGGLTLRDLDLDASMGEHRIDFQSPVVEGLRRVRLSASMGNVTVENLGNARPQTVDASGSMGNLTADFGGAWEPGSAAEMTFAQSMGELTLRVPTAVRLESDIRSSDDENRRRPADAAETDDANAPILKVRVSTSMGETRVVRY